MKTAFPFFLGLALIATQTQAKDVDPDIANYFSGSWSGKGHFASGKPIEADAIFQLDLDGQWLTYRHTDREPNRYKAYGMWGYDKGEGKLVFTVNDNFGGARKFYSEGWQQGTLTFTREGGQSAERFIFEMVDIATFRMTFQVKKTEQDWKLVDTLDFSRK